MEAQRSCLIAALMMSVGEMRCALRYSQSCKDIQILICLPALMFLVENAPKEPIKGWMHPGIPGAHLGHDRDQDQDQDQKGMGFYELGRSCHPLVLNFEEDGGLRLYSGINE